MRSLPQRGCWHQAVGQLRRRHGHAVEGLVELHRARLKAATGHLARQGVGSGLGETGVDAGGGWHGDWHCNCKRMLALRQAVAMGSIASLH